MIGRARPCLLSAVAAVAAFLCGCVSYAMRPGEVLLSSDNVVLPAHWQERWDFITVDATVNDSGPFTFLLDTGATNVTVVSPQVARRRSGAAGLLAQFVGATDAAGNRTEMQDPVKFDSVRVGGLELRDLNALVANLDDLSELLGVHVDGVLGCPAFSGGCLTLDYLRRQVCFGRGALDPVDHVRVFPLAESGAPIMDLWLGDHSVPVILDSASAGGINPGDMPSSIAVDYLPIPIEYASGSAGKQLERRWARIPGVVRLGSISLVDPVVRVGQGRGVVGAKVLKHYRVVLDLAHARVALEGGPRSPVLDSPIGTGATLAVGPDGCGVDEILPGSPADVAGLRRGDSVLSVDDVPTGADAVREIGATELAARVERLVNALGSRRKFVVRRGERTLEMEIPVVELVR